MGGKVGEDTLQARLKSVDLIFGKSPVKQAGHRRGDPFISLFHLLIVNRIRILRRSLLHGVRTM